MPRILTITLLGSGCVFITDDEYTQRLHQSGAGTSDTPCVQVSWWTDSDGDGYGDPDGLIEACEQPDGTADNADDCDDTDAERTPDTVWYTDADGDGYGGESTQVTGCDAPAGSVPNGDDCNDANGAVNPGAEEDCGTPIDDNCSAQGDDPGTNDEDAIGCLDWYADVDEDGFAGDELACLCEAEAPFLFDVSKDCDDDSPEINPAAEELCGNGIDDDCDGTAGGCGIAGTQSLSDGDVTISGAVTDARFGNAIAVGDLTGDGVHDVVLSGYHWSGNTGRVVMASGPLTGDLSTAELPHWDGAESGDRLGIGLAVLGDTNGDGYADLILGAPNADGGAAWSGGEAYLINGPIDTAAEFSLLADMDARIRSHAGGAYLGRNIGAVGDFNGDELADVLIGSVGFNEVLLFFGPMSEDIDASDPEQVGTRLSGPGGTETSIDTAGAGDVDGDGLADVLIGARYGGSANNGKVYLVYGHASPADEIILNDEADSSFTGVLPSDVAGSALAGADVDGDGLSDLIIGAPGADGGSVNAGVVYVINAPTAGASVLGDSAWLTLSGERAYGRMGVSVAHVLNADGADGSFVVAGAPESGTGEATSPGDVWVFDATTGGSMDTSAAIGQLMGTTAVGLAGAAIAAGADLDGDGVADLLVGEPQVDTTVGSGGTVTLFSGGGL